MQRGRLARVLGICAILLLSGCGDWRVDLPNGYSLVRVFGGAVVIASDREVVIDANVEGYAVLGDLVVGSVSDEGLPSPHLEESTPGYFIVNTSSDDVEEGLDQHAWLRALAISGIRGFPRLHRPSRFDDWLFR